MDRMRRHRGAAGGIGVPYEARPKQSGLPDPLTSSRLGIGPLADVRVGNRWRNASR